MNIKQFRALEFAILSDNSEKVKEMLNRISGSEADWDGIDWEVEDPTPYNIFASFNENERLCIKSFFTHQRDDDTYIRDTDLDINSHVVIFSHINRNQTGSITTVYGHSGTLLEVAIKRDNIEIIKSLITAGVKINEVDKYSSNFPLGIAAEAGKINALSTLIRLGANINLSNTHGTKAIDYAISHSQTHAVQFLLDNGSELPNSIDGVFHSPSPKGQHIVFTDILFKLLNVGAPCILKQPYNFKLLVKEIGQVLSYAAKSDKAESFKPLMILSKFFNNPEIAKEDQVNFRDALRDYYTNFDLTSILKNVDNKYSFLETLTEFERLMEERECDFLKDQIKTIKEVVLEKPLPSFPEPLGDHDEKILGEESQIHDIADNIGMLII